MSAPQWASALLARVCEAEAAEPPTLVWRRRQSIDGDRPYYSSGHYKRKTHSITVTAGAARRDQKLVLLHEITHALTPGESHSLGFWETAFRLYRAYGVPIRYARTREVRYRKTAEAGYRHSYRAALRDGTRAASPTKGGDITIAS